VEGIGSSDDLDELPLALSFMGDSCLTRAKSSLVEDVRWDGQAKAEVGGDVCVGDKSSAK
jgi:hypothetical protein